MKAEINNENKAKFFALYWGLEIGLGLNGQIDSLTDKKWKAQSAFTECIELKPLSSISDEEISYVKSVTRYKDDADVYSMIFSLLGKSLPRRRNIEHWRVALILDYLRSKGYALPYLGLSVEDLTKAGWIKII